MLPGVKPLDPGQERELAFAQSQDSAWVILSLTRRGLLATVVCLAVGVSAASIASLAEGPWLLVGVGSALLFCLVLLPHVLVPERMLRVTTRLMTPSVEAMNRGDHNRSWPG